MTNSKQIEFFPDGSKIDDWFYEYYVPNLEDLGKQYVLTDYNIYSDGKIYTNEIQAIIDMAFENGGGVIVVPEGTFMTGSLYFKQGVNLYICKNGILKGSDDPSDYDVYLTRIEGETCNYLVALINADGIDGFKIMGEGMIDGNGLHSWKSFWHRRKWNPKCTNKDEQRARLVYVSNCSNVLFANVTLSNSQFWTTHIYKCNHVKYLNCTITSPSEPVKAPSTDAIDIDVCTDVLIKGCYLEVNDDAVALKGGKGINADTDASNGLNERIIVEDSTYGFCHSCLTCGSESIHNRNIIVRRIKVNSGKNLLWLKMRPDTPQLYEGILIDQVEAKVTSFININPWTQFANLIDKEECLMSYAKNITISNTNCECTTYFNVKAQDDQYTLEEFKFDNLRIKAKLNRFNENIIKNLILNDVIIDEYN